MRNHFLIQSLCSAVVFFSAMQSFALETGGSIPEDESFKVLATTQNANLDSSVNAWSSSLMSFLPGIGMVKSEKLLQEIMAATINLKQSKLTCASSADTAEMLCIEGKSTQATIAKGIIDAAGPVLATINSAQKTCSTTASTMNLAQQAMTLAKGACVGAKLICDNSCTKANAELKALNSKVTILLTEMQIEYTELKFKFCNSPTTAFQCSELQMVLPSMNGYKAAVPPAFAAETAALPKGTVISLVTRCQGYSKDLVLFATNIFGLFQANKSAAECEKKLAAAGPASPTKEEYCKVPANSSTSFCKCQKDNTAEGCAGHVAALSTASKPNDGKANDIKSDGKGNQFAGGFDKIKMAPVDLGNLKADPAGSNSDDKKAKDGSSATAGPGGSAAGTAGGGANGSSAGKTADSKEAVAGADKKKLGLGTFSGSDGGGSSGSGSGKNNSGALGQKDMDAIQRQIASEKLRAEISGASGKSNWEKVSERYVGNKSTLLSEQ